MKISNNDTTQTISDFVNIAKDNSIQMHNSSYFIEYKGVIFEDYNIFRDKYLGIILDNVESFTFTDEDFVKFKYRPKALSAKLFGTIDYWYIILLANNMCSHLEFKRKTIKIPTFECIREMRKCLMKEEAALIKNHESL